MWETKRVVGHFLHVLKSNEAGFLHIMGDRETVLFGLSTPALNTDLSEGHFKVC